MRHFMVVKWRKKVWVILCIFQSLLPSIREQKKFEISDWRALASSTPSHWLCHLNLVTTISLYTFKLQPAIHEVSTSYPQCMGKKQRTWKAQNGLLVLFSWKRKHFSSHLKSLCIPGGHWVTSLVHMCDQRFSKHTLIAIFPLQEKHPLNANFMWFFPKFTLNKFFFLFFFLRTCLVEFEKWP